MGNFLFYLNSTTRQTGKKEFTLKWIKVLFDLKKKRINVKVFVTFSFLEQVKKWFYSCLIILSSTCPLNRLGSGRFYLRSLPLKGTTWIPRGPPSFDTSTSLTMSLGDGDEGVDVMGGGGGGGDRKVGGGGGHHVNKNRK